MSIAFDANDAAIIRSATKTQGRAVRRGLGGHHERGRKPKLTKHQARAALRRVAAGETLREVALSYAVDHSTISRLKARDAAEMN